MYRSFHPRRKEKIVQRYFGFWHLPALPIFYGKLIPIQFSAALLDKTKDRTVLNRCIDNTVSNTLPSLSIFFDCEGLSKENITQTNTFFSSDPFYQQFQNNIGCSPDKKQV